MGSCYTSLGEFELALDAFEEALTSHSSRWHRSIIQTDIATIYDQEGEHEKAIEHLRQALALLRGDRDTATHTRRRCPAGPLDGRLFMHEIDDLELPAELVVFSACNSAQGRMIRGEGLVGLTRAVFLAGANRALVSLWSVHDEATSELMIAFYEALLTQGLPPAQALRAAQRRMLSSERWQAPYYWAGFVLQGDWRWRLATL
jgi:CHAT domain-containing protein